MGRGGERSRSSEELSKDARSEPSEAADTKESSDKWESLAEAEGSADERESLAEGSAFTAADAEAEAEGARSKDAGETVDVDDTSGSTESIKANPVDRRAHRTSDGVRSEASRARVLLTTMSASRRTSASPS